MNTKLFEIHDRMTLIPALAVRLEPDGAREGILLMRAGFGTTFEAQRRYVILTWLTSKRSEYDPFGWNDRTLHHAHEYIVAHWDELESGSVVDVRKILGEQADK